MTEQAEHDIAAYELAKKFLLDLNISDVTSELLEGYLRSPEIASRPQSISDLYQRILQAAQGGGMKPKVIGGAIGGVSKLGPVLCDFEPAQVLEKYATWEQVLSEIKAKLKPRGKIRKVKRGIWPLYCQTILSAAQFMLQFGNAQAFYQWVDMFDSDDRTRVALPMILDKEISGIGFALACDFLKELGYAKFVKPDVMLRDIFRALKLCSPKADDYELFKAIIRVANNVKVEPYNVDKLFWLIGSGHFYKHQDIGKKGRIGNNKKKFIAYAKGELHSQHK